MADATTEKPKVEVKKESPVLSPIRDMSLPEVTGLLTTRIMKALQGSDSATIQATIKTATSDLEVWYESQPLTGRRDLAIAAKRSMEQFRLISEQLFHTMVTLTLKDM